ncbi:hypothetical protein Tco_1538679 [Tanacetum coccineum]
MDALDEFKSIFGLVPSIPKSKAYFCNVLNHVKLSILNAMPFVEGKLPVKYLGVPLISSILMNHDCRILVERVKSRVGDWKNNSSSFAGEMKRDKAKVAWNIMCFPKQEGGLVSDIIVDGGWAWPLSWYTRAPILYNCMVHALSPDCEDQLVWKDFHGIKKSFSVYVVETSFGLGKLKTHDMLRQWDVGDATKLNLFLCPFCKLVSNSHNHLFLECLFPLQVWYMVCSRAGMDGIDPIWDDIVDWIKPLSTKRSVFSVVARLVLERNLRLFHLPREKPSLISELKEACGSSSRHYCSQCD